MPNLVRSMLYRHQPGECVWEENESKNCMVYRFHCSFACYIVIVIYDNNHFIIKIDNPHRLGGGSGLEMLGSPGIVPFPVRKSN